MRQLLITVLAVLAALLLAPVGASAKTLVSYEREGGFSGTPLRLTVTAKGLVRYVSGTGAEGERYTLTAKRLTKLKKVLKASRFGKLETDYRPMPGTVADGFTHHVRYGGKTVLSGDGGTPPRRLERLINFLSGLATPQ